VPAGVKAEVSMPALSSTMKEGKIVQWAKKVGDRCLSPPTREQPPFLGPVGSSEQTAITPA
jgi:hypothetical protein